MIAAELTPNRKSAQCPECHRLLAVRVRLSDGRHVLFLDPEWRLHEPDLDRLGALGVEPDDERLGGTWMRPWQRRDAGQQARHLPRQPGIAVDPGARVMCGCQRRITLEAEALDVSPHRFDPA